MANSINMCSDFQRNWRSDHNPLSAEITTGGAIELYNPYINTVSRDLWYCTSVDDLAPNQSLQWTQILTGLVNVADNYPVLIPGTLLNAAYTIILKAKYSGTITSFVASCTSLVTAGNYTIKINNTSVTGLTSITNTVAVTETNATANNTFVVGDSISITFSGSLTLLTFQGQLSITRKLV